MEILDSANIIRQNRKTIKVEFTNFGSLNVYCPYNLSYKKIEELLMPKYNIIRKKTTILKNNFEKNKDILNYKKVLILGKQYNINKTDKAKKVLFSNDDIFIPTRYFEMKKLNFIIKKTLLDISKSILKSRIVEICKIYNKMPQKVLIGSFKSKWGSCDNFKVIKLNWKLVMLPQNLIDFVIYHELSHLQELNHSKKFYEILQNYEPNHKVLRKNLKEYNYLLSLY